MPNIFLDLRGLVERTLGKPEKRDGPAQGLVFSSGDIPLKTTCGPFKMKLRYTTAEILPAVPGLRYYLYSYHLSGYNEGAGDAGKYVGLEFTSGGVGYVGPRCYLIAGVASHSASSGIMGILTDENTSVTFSATNVKEAVGIICYAEVQSNDV